MVGGAICGLIQYFFVSTNPKNLTKHFLISFHSPKLVAFPSRPPLQTQINAYINIYLICCNNKKYKNIQSTPKDHKRRLQYAHHDDKIWIEPLYIVCRMNSYINKIWRWYRYAMRYKESVGRSDLLFTFWVRPSRIASIKLADINDRRSVHYHFEW